VVACLAARIGRTVGTCDVEKIAIRRVASARPAAHVYDSSELPLKFVAPPNPRQRDRLQGFEPRDIRELGELSALGPVRHPAPFG